MSKSNMTLGDALSIMAGRTDHFKHRERENYGRVELSVQASEGHYCSPREYMESLSDYDSVEIAIFLDGKWSRPSEIGLPAEVDDLWENDLSACVGGYIPQAVLAQVREAAKAFGEASHE